MNKEKLKLWIDALRSGEYEQATGQLAHMDEDGTKSYCCLGVLCEVAIKDGLDLHVRWAGEGGSCGCGDCAPVEPVDTAFYDGEENVLTSKMREWIGLGGGETPTVKATFEIREKLKYADDSYGEEINVITLNDEAKMSFDEIADALEQTWLREDK